MSDDLIDINVTIDMIPSIKEKTIIDFVNIISVNKDIIKTRKDRDFLLNTFATLTSKNKREINLMFDNINTQFEAVNEYLNYFENILIQSLSALNIITDHLIETRSGIMQLQDSFYEKISNMEKKINDIKDNLEKQIKHIDLKLKAKNEIDAEFNKLKLGYFNDFTVIERIKIILENLYFGDTGNLFQNNNDEKYIEELSINIKAKIMGYLKENMPDSQILKTKDIFNFNNKKDESKIIIENLFNYELPFAKAVYSVNKKGFNDSILDNIPGLYNFYNIDILTKKIFDEFICRRKYFYE